MTTAFMTTAFMTTATTGLVARGYTRPVSAAERTWLIADRLCPPFAINLILEGEGTPDPERWTAAVALAAAANPGMRVRLHGAVAWSKWVDCGQPPPVNVVDAPHWDGQSSDGAAFLARPMDLRSGHSADVWLVSGPSNRVVVRVHHAVADGDGILHFAAEIGRALRGEPLEGSPSLSIDLDLARPVGEKRTFPPETAFAPTGLHRGAGRGMHWRRRHVSTVRSRFLSHAAEFVGVETRRHAIGEGTVRVDVPVNLRRHDTSVRSTANLVGMLTLDVPEGATAASFDSTFREQIASGRHADSLVSAQAIRWVPLWLGERFATGRSADCNRSSRYGSSAILSNVGRVQSEVFSGPDFRVRRVCVMPPAGHAAPFFVVFTGHSEGCEVMASMPAPLATDGRFDQLMDGLAAAIS